MPSKKDGTYKVGRGRPPRSGQFQKGKSGNPRGRPKGAKNLHKLLLDEGQERIGSREGTKEKQIPKSVAAIKLLYKDALSGDARRGKELLDRLLKAEEALAAAEDRAPSYPFTDADRAVIEEIYARMKSFEEK